MHDPDIAARLTRIEAVLVRLVAKVDALTAKPKPHLSRTEFARAVGVHPNTITRWLNLGRIRTEKGRIPVSELGKFTSRP